MFKWTDQARLLCVYLRYFNNAKTKIAQMFVDYLSYFEHYHYLKKHAVDILGQVFEKNVVLFIHTFGRTGDGSCELLL